MWARPFRATRIHSWPAAAHRRNLSGCFALLVLLVSLNSAWACETPVYRYAMYRWQPTPYEVYSFHDAAHADSHAAVEKAIAEVSEGTDNRANVVFIPVNLTTDPELNGVTPDIKQAWESQPNPVLPSYLISTPYGVQIYAGKLDRDAIKSLVDSPARKRLAQQLEAGKIGVMLMLGGKDQQQNEQTRQILTGLVKEIAEGKISLYAAPSTFGASEPEVPAGAPSGELGLIEVNREDEEEAWLVRSLLAMESDLPQETRPMVFLTYGRGRALLPYIGEGITRENLIREVQFISGACSCTVKEQNPGVDLLVRYDWDAAAAALADRFGTEEGNESQFGPSDFLPQLIIPSSAPVPDPDAAATTDVTATDVAAVGPEAVDVATSDPAAEEDASVETGAAAAASEQEPVADQEDLSAANPGNQASEPGEDAAPNIREAANKGAPREGAEDRAEVAIVTPDEALQQSAPVPNFKSQRTYLGMAIVGGGLALGLVILFGLTFFVMRPH